MDYTVSCGNLGGNGCVIIGKKNNYYNVVHIIFGWIYPLAWFYNNFIIPYYMKFCDINLAIFN